MVSRDAKHREPSGELAEPRPSTHGFALAQDEGIIYNALILSLSKRHLQHLFDIQKPIFANTLPDNHVPVFFNEAANMRVG